MSLKAYFKKKSMVYQNLSRKWRPKKFSDVIGQDLVLKILKNSIFLKRLHHAYLLYGMYGTGKTTIARLLAKSLNCELNITYDPCCKCSNCKEIENNRFVDLIEINSALHTKVEEILEILNSVQYTPIKGRFKIYIFDEVHMLSRSSFNALLKILEEPPKYVKFLLATTNIQKIPETILSRCLHLYFQRIDIESIIKKLMYVLENEGVKIDSQALNLLAYESQGSMRDALNLVDKVIVNSDVHKKITMLQVESVLGIIGKNVIISLIELIINNKIDDLLFKIENLSIKNINWENLLNDILSILHKIAIYQVLPNQNIENENKNTFVRIRELSHKITKSKIHEFYKIILSGKKYIHFFSNKRIYVEMIFLQIHSLF